MKVLWWEGGGLVYRLGNRVNMVGVQSVRRRVVGDKVEDVGKGQILNRNECS